jgi:hypothetical protein
MAECSNGKSRKTIDDLLDTVGNVVEVGKSIQPYIPPRSTASKILHFLLPLAAKYNPTEQTQLLLHDLENTTWRAYQGITENEYEIIQSLPESEFYDALSDAAAKNRRILPISKGIDTVDKWMAVAGGSAALAAYLTGALAAIGVAIEVTDEAVEAGMKGPFLAFMGYLSFANAKGKGKVDLSDLSLKNKMTAIKQLYPVLETIGWEMISMTPTVGEPIDMLDKYVQLTERYIRTQALQTIIANVRDPQYLDQFELTDD